MYFKHFIIINTCLLFHNLRDITRIVWGGKTIAGANSAGGKSELRRAGCRVTPGGGDPEESATESKPPSEKKVRVKR